MPARNATRRALAALALATGLGGCDAWYNAPSPDDLMHNVPWFDHMIVSRAVNPYSRVDVPRYTPAGAIPITGGEGDWKAEWVVQNLATADRLVNPTTASTKATVTGPEIARIPREVAARGDSLYGIYCSMCHGQAGAANGTVSKKIAAPSLLTPRARGYTDGYLYSIVKYGRGLMPRYGDKVYEPIDRWAIVNHVRKLQSQAPLDATQTQAVGGSY